MGTEGQAETLLTACPEDVEERSSSSLDPRKLRP